MPDRNIQPVINVVKLIKINKTKNSCIYDVKDDGSSAFKSKNIGITIAKTKYIAAYLK